MARHKTPTPSTSETHEANIKNKKKRSYIPQKWLGTVKRIDNGKHKSVTGVPPKAAWNLIECLKIEVLIGRSSKLSCRSCSGSGSPYPTLSIIVKQDPHMPEACLGKNANKGKPN